MSLLAHDLAETERFYASLGFVLCGEGVETGWIEVRLDDLALQFYADPPVGTPKAPIMSGTIYVHTETIETIETLASRWKDRVAFEWGPETMDYGMRELAFCDPNGYLIAFAAPA
ncbi:MAG: VOC family protein [Vitreimonas sp.]